MDTNKSLIITETPLNSSRPELELFLSYLEEKGLAPHQRPFEKHRKQTNTYRLIFALLGLTFFSFAAYIYMIQMNWTFTILFNGGPIIKSFFMFFSLCLSCISFWISLKLRPEREAVMALKKRAQTVLRNIPYRMRREALEQINHTADVALQLMAIIATTQFLSREAKMKLFNQSLLELQERFQHVFDRYQQIS